jgi:hypothetical protein
LKNKKRYEYYLNPKSKEDGAGSEYFTILSPLITRTNILNYSEITFSSGATNAGYTSLQALNADTTHPKIKQANDLYFNAFFF